MKKSILFLSFFICFLIKINSSFSQFSIGPSIGIGATHFQVATGSIAGDEPGFMYALVYGINAKYIYKNNLGISILSHFSENNYPGQCGCLQCSYGDITYDNINTSVTFDFVKFHNMYFGMGLSINHWFNWKANNVLGQDIEKTIKYDIRHTILGVNISPKYEYGNFVLTILYYYNFLEFSTDDLNSVFKTSGINSKHFLGMYISYLFDINKK